VRYDTELAIGSREDIKDSIRKARVACQDLHAVVNEIIAEGGRVWYIIGP
jgi:hypothetical protein